MTSSRHLRQLLRAGSMQVGNVCSYLQVIACSCMIVIAPLVQHTQPQSRSCWCTSQIELGPPPLAIWSPPPSTSARWSPQQQHPRPPCLVQHFCKQLVWMSAHSVCVQGMSRAVTVEHPALQEWSPVGSVVFAQNKPRSISLLSLSSYDRQSS